MGKIKNYFPGGNTPDGFYSFYQYLPFHAERIYIFKGGPGTGKSTFMKKIAAKACERNYEIELHWCSSDNNSLDGVVIPDLKVAFFDGTKPHINDPAFPGLVGEIINMGQYWDRAVLKKYKKEIFHLNELIGLRFKQAYSYLSAARTIYLHRKTYYRQSQDTEKYHKIVYTLINDEMKKSEIKTGPARHLFASAITPGGPVSYLENLSEDINKRIILKGKPGTGKSKLIKSFCNEAERYGFFILYLHCPLEPENLDGAIIPEMDLALLVDMPPHNLETIRENDRIIDLGETIDLQYIKKYNGEILDAEKLYEDMMKRVYYFLKSAREYHDELEQYYVESLDFEEIDQLREKIIKEILP